MHHLLHRFLVQGAALLLDVGVRLWQKRIILKSNNERLFFSLQSEKEWERESPFCSSFSGTRENMNRFLQEQKGNWGQPITLVQYFAMENSCTFKEWLKWMHMQMCPFIHHCSLGHCSLKSHRGVSLPPSMAPTPRWAGLGSFTGPQAHRKVGLTKMSSISLCVRPCLWFPLPSTATLPSPPKWPFDCVNETKNLEKDKGNSLSCFYSKERPSQVTSHRQDGQSKTAFTHYPCLLASEEKENPKAFGWQTEHNWNICISAEHRRQCGWAEDTEALGDKCFLPWL